MHATGSASSDGDNSDGDINVVAMAAAPRWLLDFLALADTGDQYLYIQVQASVSLALGVCAAADSPRAVDWARSTPSKRISGDARTACWRCWVPAHTCTCDSRTLSWNAGGCVGGLDVAACWFVAMRAGVADA